MQGTSKAFSNHRLINLNQRKDNTALAMLPTFHFLSLLLMGPNQMKLQPIPVWLF